MGAILGLLSPIVRYLLPLALGALGMALPVVRPICARRAGTSEKGLAIAGVVRGAIATVIGVIGALALNDAVSSLG